MNRLQRLYTECGQSPWLDNLRRGWITGGQLVELRDRGVRGLTSNPTIFQKAIQGSADYDEQFSALTRSRVAPRDAYWSLVLRDIDSALDVFAPVYESSGGEDGFVSVEVDPNLAHDSGGTLMSARELHERVGRPNVMIKIPATREGLPAIRAMIAEGRSVNVTLIFSLERYAQVLEAYVAGLEDLARSTTSDLSHVASVGSFFISRVDTEVDRRLEAIGTPDALALRGRAAVAQGQLAYRMFTEVFRGARWQALAARGARLQRPLWASTSTKNPAYRDTLYVEELIGPHTVNTLPDATLEAFDDHGQVARRVDIDVDAAAQTWQAIAAVGVDHAAVAEQLEREGVSSFQKSFDELLTALTAKAAELS
ncbi:MAG: transaldolase [Actinobacteria bacterium]|nr:transaldolase [Actinomycetota bacterium]